MEWIQRTNTLNGINRNPYKKGIVVPGRCIHEEQVLPVCYPSLMAQLGMHSGCLGVTIVLPLDLLVTVKLQHGMLIPCIKQEN